MAILKSQRISSRSSRNTGTQSLSMSDSVSAKFSPKAASPEMSLKSDTSTLRSKSAQQEKFIKSLLKSFKRLEISLGKFDGKSNGLTKTNLLRTVVLPFLRSSPPLHALLDPSSKLYTSFASISTSVLGCWWGSLLSGLNATGPQQVSASDRSAYLECVSRILAREEWLLADAQALETYTSRLTDTLDFCISRLLSSKMIPISISAFVGKVFAYSFYHLPGVCNALLFLLNVKQRTLDGSSRAFSPRRQFSKAVVAHVFPKYVTHLIDYKGLEKLEKIKRGAINCVVPPRSPVRGIRDPSGPWVRRWCTNDSDVFNSFFRHYINIANSLIETSPSDLPLILPEAFPGFRVITAYMYQIISVSMNKISFNKSTTNFGPNVQSAGSQPPPQKPAFTKEGASGSGLPPSGFSFKQSDSNYTSITKLFRSIRDISFSPISFASQITKIVDLLLASVAQSIGLYDVNKTGLLLNLVYEYSIHVLDASDMNWAFWLDCCYLMLTRTYHVQIITRTFAFLFNVWDKIPNLLEESESARNHVWLTDSTESMKVNFSNWLTSSPVWLVYFSHWNPLVRSHYLRLLVWRVIGANNFETSCSIQTTRRIRQKSNHIFEHLCQALASDDLPDFLSALDFSSDSPIVNRKFGIVPVNGKYTYLDEVSSLMSIASPSKPSDLRKTHPYEILDEAVYICTSLPSSPGNGKLDSVQQKTDENHSIIDSLSRFFKSISTDDSTSREALHMTPPAKLGAKRGESNILNKKKPFSKSMTSLASAFSTKSMSPSSSFASFQSSPDSLNDTSTESSITSDTDSSLSDRMGSSSASTFSSESSQMQPPELIKVPPEIIRPLFKLDMILDHNLASAKCTKMQESKSSSGRVFYGCQKKPNLTYLTLPKPPKSPSISIFLNSDAYNRFYITREDYQMGEEALPLADVQDFEAFSKHIAGMANSPTELTALGKALNEWNAVVDEFESYLFEKVEADQANCLPIASADGATETTVSGAINEFEYFARIIPLLPIDNFTESKLFNAA